MNHATAAAQHKEEVKDVVVKNARKFAHDKILEEVVNTINNLNVKYDTSKDDGITCDEILKRKEMKGKYASELDRLKLLIDRLLDYTDVQYDSKELIINDQLLKVARLDELRECFEDKLRMDLEQYDLSDQKLKLATLTKIDIGKFSGLFEKGDDFYTFKSKFLKAYKNHPKDLKVEWLKNNHLDGKAKECVGSLENIEEIWSRLKANFGNTEQLLMYYFSKINKMGHLSRQKTFSAKKHYVQSLINAMNDVSNLATEHDLLGELHYGPQLGKIVLLLENYLQTGWYTTTNKENVLKRNRWLRMITYLEEQLSIIQTRVFEVGSADFQASSSNDPNQRNRDPFDKLPRNEKKAQYLVGFVNELCNLCEEKHPNANRGFVQCKKFLLMSPKQRCDHVRKKKICLQCLDGKTKWNDSEHSCSDKWVCQHESHKKYEKKLHLLVCELHTDEQNNKQLFDEFKKEVLKAEWQQRIFKDTANYVTRDSAYLKKKYNANNDNVSNQCDDSVVDASCVGSPVFLLQPVPFNDHVFNLMFDSGCANFVCRKGALDHLPDDCKENIIKGPIIINGVGCNKVTSTHGHYSIKLPIHDGRLAKFNGICLDIILARCHHILFGKRANPYWSHMYLREVRKVTYLLFPY